MRDEAPVIPSLSRETLRGTWGTVLLPIADGDRIDLAAIAAQLDVLTTSGLDGIYSNGTAGEFFTQDEDEFDAVAELLADACQAAGLACQIGASHPSAQVCRARIQAGRPAAPVCDPGDPAGLAAAVLAGGSRRRRPDSSGPPAGYRWCSTIRHTPRPS